MPRFRLFAIVFLSVSALASELTVKVIDPQSAAVAGAQVELFREGSARPLAIQTTSPQGTARFENAPATNLRVHALAPGFAEQWTSVSSNPGKLLTVKLTFAVATETVVVTATRTPAPGDETGAAIAILDYAGLQTMLPVAANEAFHFLPGAIVSTAGQRGGLGSLFVRGGDSRYNKVIVDGVPINDPGGTFDFGTLPLFEAERMEFSRGAQSTLYGSDAMSSVVQVWSRTGQNQFPELRFGADAGNYGSESGYASLAGARGRFDYNVFGNQFNTTGSGPNDDYSNSLAGANLGARLNEWASLRLRARHDNSVSGVQSVWKFNGDPLLPPDLDQRARQNNFLGSLELSITGPSRWQQRITGFDYTLHRTNVDAIDQGDRISPFGNQDFQFHAVNDFNRAGLDYQASYAERSWTVSTMGYQFEDENGTTGNLPDTSHGIRRNHAVFVQQTLSYERLGMAAGGRFVRNQSFGNKFVPRVSLSVLVVRGGQVFSGTRLHFGYGTGIKEPTFAESFGNGGGFQTLPNPDLRPEETRAFETGFEQRLGSKYALTATYFNNLFRNKIDFNFIGCDPVTFVCTGRYVNLNEAFAHGAEAELQGRLSPRWSAILSYTYTSTQILKQPLAFDPILSEGKPLLRRPKHSALLLATYLGRRWGADLAGSFVGRRADSDFAGFNIDHAAGYVLVNAGSWLAATHRITAYIQAENLLNRSYEEVVGFPALGINFRAGMRFRAGGE
ncbi:MAG TPA: TonB-dependent receptor [Terriglobales bacterium]|nr:TonB-dependent receptor [Terriglobales bacterium]